MSIFIFKKKTKNPVKRFEHEVVSDFKTAADIQKERLENNQDMPNLSSIPETVKNFFNKLFAKRA